MTEETQPSFWRRARASWAALGLDLLNLYQPANERAQYLFCCCVGFGLVKELLLCEGSTDNIRRKRINNSHFLILPRSIFSRSHKLLMRHRLKPRAIRPIRPSIIRHIALSRYTSTCNNNHTALTFSYKIGKCIELFVRDRRGDWCCAAIGCGGADDVGGGGGWGAESIWLFKMMLLGFEIVGERCRRRNERTVWGYAISICVNSLNFCGCMKR